MVKFTGKLTAAVLFLSVAMGGRSFAAGATVTVSDFKFVDLATGTNKTKINVGDTVTWNWVSGSHSATSGSCDGKGRDSSGSSTGSDDGGGSGSGSGDGAGETCKADGVWDSGVASPPFTFTRTFSAPGEFHYFSTPDGSVMEGEIEVESAGDGAPEPPEPPEDASSPCTPSATTLCLDDEPGDNRFEVEVEFETSQGGGLSGHAGAVPLKSVGMTKGGLFWFFSPDTPELMVKVLNGCATNGHRWLFASGGTNVGLKITLKDTRTGKSQFYSNPDLHALQSIQDTTALPGCQ